MNTFTISVAVCDDEAVAREELLHWLRKAILPADHRLSLTELTSGDELLSRQRAGLRFDIIFLDMIMPGTGGLETARQLRDAGDQALIICLTSSPDFAVQSYRVNAFDYLMKESGTDQLQQCLDRAITAVNKRPRKKLLIKSGTSTRSVVTEQIEYIEVFSKKLSYHLLSGEVIESYKPIRDLELELQDLPEFFKIHRSIIVNLACIIEITPHHVKTVSSEQLPVARGKYDPLEKAFLKISAMG